MKGSNIVEYKLNLKEIPYVRYYTGFHSHFDCRLPSDDRDISKVKLEHHVIAFAFFSQIEGVVVWNNAKTENNEIFLESKEFNFSDLYLCNVKVMTIETAKRLYGSLSVEDWMASIDFWFTLPVDTKILYQVHMHRFSTMLMPKICQPYKTVILSELGCEEIP